MRPDYNFARVATQEVVPVLLQLLTAVDEDADDDEINPPRAAANCLALYAQAVGQPVVPPVLSFIEQNLRHQDWHYRDAALSAFGALTLVPDETALEPLVKQALPVLMSMISDEAPSVQDSAAYTLCRICENIPQAIDPGTHLAPLVASLFGGLSSDPHLATSCCAALNNLAGLFVNETDDGQNPLTPHFKDSVTHILQVTDR